MSAIDSFSRKRRLMVASLLSAGAGAGACDAQATEPDSLAGTWRLIAADVIEGDGKRARDYGAAPKGLLMIDAAGRYTLQIFKAERPRFARPDKAAGSPEEFAAAVTGSSSHYGSVSVDPAARTLTFSIEGASFPNWEGIQQVRVYELTDGQLSYRVQPRSDGRVPISVWQRLR